MTKAPGTATAQPSVAMLPTLAMIVGIMKIPAPIMLPATSIVAEVSPTRLALELIAALGLVGEFRYGMDW
ncbi:MAG: hypothetical protein ACREXT_15275, partial [Gammaproteobacteria bacterium]